MRDAVAADLDDDMPTTLPGKCIKYDADGETCEIHCFPTTRGGSYWEFIRSDKVYPLHLGKDGTNMLIQLWHAVFYQGKDVLLQQSDGDEKQ
jgi:hypothetical protein